MILLRLGLRDFRSYAALVWEPGPGLNLVVGPNGSGKTNALEAVCLAAGMRLRPIARDLDLLRHASASLRVVATLAPDAVVPGAAGAAGREGDGDGAVHTVEVAIAGRSRRYLRDGQAARPASDGTPSVVAFTPDDLDVVKGGPDSRRQLLERDLAQASLAYRDLLRRYTRALTQRNAVLRAIGEGNAGDDALEPWDVAVATAGAGVQAWRAQALAVLAPMAAAAYARVAGPGKAFAVAYRARTRLDAPTGAPDGPPAGDPPPRAQAATDPAAEVAEGASALRAALRAAHSAEIARGYTLVGPHRDDLAFRLDGREMRAYASQGEQRSAVVCLKMALLEYLEARRGDRPLLVLDDVLSELDAVRQDRLLEAAKGYQTFISTTAVPAAVAGARIVRAGGGTLEPWQEDARGGEPPPSP